MQLAPKITKYKKFTNARSPGQLYSHAVKAKHWRDWAGHSLSRPQPLQQYNTVVACRRSSQLARSCAAQNAKTEHEHEKKKRTCKDMSPGVKWTKWNAKTLATTLEWRRSQHASQLEPNVGFPGKRKGQSCSGKNRVVTAYGDARWDESVAPHWLASSLLVLRWRHSTEVRLLPWLRVCHLHWHQFAFCHRRGDRWSGRSCACAKIQNLGRGEFLN